MTRTRAKGNTRDRHRERNLTQITIVQFDRFQDCARSLADALRSKLDGTLALNLCQPSPVIIHGDLNVRIVRFEGKACRTSRISLTA